MLNSTRNLDVFLPCAHTVLHSWCMRDATSTKSLLEDFPALAIGTVPRLAVTTLDWDTDVPCLGRRARDSDNWSGKTASNLDRISINEEPFLPSNIVLA